MSREQFIVTHFFNGDGEAVRMEDKLASSSIVERSSGELILVRTDRLTPIPKPPYGYGEPYEWKVPVKGDLYFNAGMWGPVIYEKFGRYFPVATPIHKPAPTPPKTKVRRRAVYVSTGSFDDSVSHSYLDHEIGFNRYRQIGETRIVLPDPYISLDDLENNHDIRVTRLFSRQWICSGSGNSTHYLTHLDAWCAAIQSVIDKGGV